MTNTKKIISFLILSLTFILVLTNFFQGKVIGQEDSTSEIKHKLEAISDEEKKILQDLFVLTQEIKTMEKEEKMIIKELEMLNYEIQKTEMIISDKEKDYKKKIDALNEILKSYQRRGTRSYLEIILESENLTMFLRRINLLRDLAKGTSELLDYLDESKEKLSSERSKLDEKLLLLEQKKKQLRVALDKKFKLKEDIETYLESLQEERQHYEENLNNIQKMWDELKTLLADTTKTFSKIIEDGTLQINDIDITFSFSGIKGVIKEKTFNDVIAGHPSLTEMTFDFEMDKMTVYLPEENLVLSGKFVILDNSSLIFKVEKGTFYDIPLEKALIDELFEEGYLILNLKPILGDNILRSVEIQEGQIELLVIPR